MQMQALSRTCIRRFWHLQREDFVPLRVEVFVHGVRL